MDKKTVFVKTHVGEVTISGMSGEMRRVLMLIDDKSSYEEVTKRAPPSLRGELPEIVQQLLDAELIRDKDKPGVTSKIVTPKIVAPKQTNAAIIDELDFTSMTGTPGPSALAEQAAKEKAHQEAEMQAKRESEAVRARAELEAAVAAAKLKATAEAEAKAEAKARLDAEFAAKAKADADARAMQEAVHRQQAEAAAKAKAEAEARVRAEIEAAARAKQEAEAARLKAEQEAAQAKAELEAAKARAEAEARALAEELARREAEAARVKVEQEAARIKAEQEAVARAKAEAEERAKLEAEATRLKAEQEAARIKAEQEAAARARAEAEERARLEAEAARLKAEQEAARIRAEQEAAARAKAEAEERARLEAEAARLKAEQEAARIRAEQEAVARANAEAARLKAEQEAVRLKAEQEAAARAKAEADERARLEAAARLKAEQEAARLKAEQEAAAAAAARSEAEARAKRAAQIAEQEALAAAAKAASEPEPFRLNLDALNEPEQAVQPKAVAPKPTETQSAAQHEAEQRAHAEAKAAAELKAKQDAAAEMARLKSEQEAARLLAEQQAHAQEEEQALAAEQADAWAEAEQRAKLQAKLDAEQQAQQAALHQAKAAQKPVARAPRNPLPWGKIVFGLLAIVLLAALVLPYIWPLQEYIAPLEQRLSAQLKQPVHIGGMSAASLPPKLQLQNVTVGSGQEVKVAAVVLNFDPLTLFSANKAISNAELQEVVLDGQRLNQVANWLKGLGSDGQYPVRHLTIQSLQVNSEAIALPALKGGAEMAQGAFTRIVLHSEDDKLNIELSPVQDRWQISFGLKESTLPFLPKVMFSDFSAKGEIGEGDVSFSEIEAHAYGGIWSGRGTLGWRKGWQVQGRIQAKAMELEKLFPQFGISGEVDAEGQVQSQSVKLAQLGEALRFEGTFRATNGVINGMDMVETARLSSPTHLPGGRTHYDELTGAVQVENRTKRFRQIKITSGMLRANGSFDISNNGELSGSFDSEIKMRSGNNPLELSGTLAVPNLVAQ